MKKASLQSTLPTGTESRTAATEIPDPDLSYLFHKLYRPVKVALESSHASPEEAAKEFGAAIWQMLKNHFEESDFEVSAIKADIAKQRREREAERRDLANSYRRRT